MAGFYKEEDINRIRDSVDLIELVNELTPLKKKGAKFWGNCPFHKEKTPSFTVDPALQLYYCFGCGEGGNVYTFLMRTEKMQFGEAVRYLADRVGMNIEPIKGDDAKRSSRQSSLYDLNLKAAAFYHAQLKGTGAAKVRQYLDGRGISSETIDLFKLGHAPSVPRALFDHLIRSGFKEEDILEVGLALATDHDHTDRFRDRLIFPVMDLKGRVVGFGGRVMGDKLPKYINSPESSIYHKGSVFYGFSHTKNDVIKERSLVVVEGYTDLLLLHQFGVKNVVATCGTALTADHLNLIKKYAEKAYLVFDSDEAGKNAALKCLNYVDDILFTGYRNIKDVVGSFLDVKVIILPQGLDPADVALRAAAKLPEVFSELMRRSVNIVDFAIENILSKYDLQDTSDRMKAINESGALINKIPSALAREEYAHKVADTLKVNFETLRKEILHKRPTTFRGLQEPQGASAGTLSNATEREVLSFLVQNLDKPVALKDLVDKIEPSEFEGEVNRMLLVMLKDHLGSGSLSMADLLSFFDESNHAYITSLAMDRKIADILEEDLELYKEALLKRLRELFIERSITEKKIQFEQLKKELEDNGLAGQKDVLEGLQKRYDDLFRQIISLELEKKGI